MAQQPQGTWKGSGIGVEMGRKTKTLESAEFARGDQFMLQSIISAREINICIE